MQQTHPQRIVRLTPLADVLARIDALVQPVTPRPMSVMDAEGAVLAEDVTALADLPPLPLALRDGWAVRAEDMADASSHAPVAIVVPPRVNTGDALPEGTDAVAPFDIIVLRNGRAEAIGPVVAGEGALPSGGDARAGTRVLGAGHRLRASDIAALVAMDIERVSVRAPRVQVTAARADDRVLSAARRLIAADSAAAVGDIDGAADLLVRIGGTGVGDNDDSVAALARAGRVEAHGIGIMPGETAAFGMIGAQPVLLLPGRLDAALAVWLVIGRRMLRHLSGRDDNGRRIPATLTRKIASPLGFAEVVPVRRSGSTAEPLVSGYWPLGVIGRANGWLLVPADSEGYPAGSEVVVRPLP